MSKINLKYLWLVILSVLWLTGAFPSIEKSSTTTHLVSYAEVSDSTEFSHFEIKQKPSQYVYAGHVLWLSSLVDNIFDNTDYQILPWPEQSQINTFFKIISFQYYIASLHPIFSIN